MTARIRNDAKSIPLFPSARIFTSMISGSLSPRHGASSGCG
jgi:hypothetical protein